MGFGGVRVTTTTYCLKGRDFEIPMSGGLYVTESCAELEKFFRPGEEVVTYKGFDELVEEDPLAAGTPRRGERIRKAGL